MVKTTWTSRLWFRVRQYFRPEFRARTEEETRLARVVERRDETIEQLTDQLRAARVKEKEDAGEIKVLSREVELLALVLERDLTRVKSEIAMESHRIAQAVAQVQNRGG